MWLDADIKKLPKKHMLEAYKTTNSKFVHYSKLNSQHNWEDLYEKEEMTLMLPLA